MSNLAPTTKVRRYFRQDYSDDDTTYDIIYWDSMTGKQVLRYDGADPANTNPAYGAQPDDVYFRRRGLDYKEMIEIQYRIFTPEDARKVLYGK